MITCKGCGTLIHRLEVFPKGVCVDCHAKTFTMPTVEELTKMWGGK